MQEEENASMKRSNIAAAGLSGEPSNIASSGTLKKTVFRDSKKSSHHKLPNIHEDYCGPRHHRPKHH